MLCETIPVVSSGKTMTPPGFNTANRIFMTLLGHGGRRGDGSGSGRGGRQRHAQLSLSLLGQRGKDLGRKT